MVKCSICRSLIQELFLEKKRGTIIKKPGSSKFQEVCFVCQKQFRSKEELLKQLE